MPGKISNARLGIPRYKKDLALLFSPLEVLDYPALRIPVSRVACYDGGENAFGFEHFARLPQKLDSRSDVEPVSISGDLDFLTNRMCFSRSIHRTHSAALAGCEKGYKGLKSFLLNTCVISNI